MRTTLRLDDDVLMAVRERARRERRSAGAVLSDLARQSLNRTGRPDSYSREVLGFAPLPHRGATVSNTLINRIREDEGE